MRTAVSRFRAGRAFGAARMQLIVADDLSWPSYNLSNHEERSHEVLSRMLCRGGKART
jgi:hypothetical protein